MQSTAEIYRRDLPRRPSRLSAAPLNKQGYPVPFFASKHEGEYDFRIMDSDKFVQAIQHSLCWVCGQRLGSFKSFIVGPMCAVNRTNGEPPCHLDCALYSAMACPYFANPKRRRNAKGIDESAYTENAAGIALVTPLKTQCVYTTRSYEVMKLPNGVLFQMGEPTSIDWFHAGRHATREEVDEAIAAGLPKLQALAAEDGGESLLETYVRRLDKWLPDAKLGAGEAS